MSPFAAVLAHQGGWDEALLVLAPIVVIVLALAVVKRRVDRMALDEPADTPVAGSADRTDS